MGMILYPLLQNCFPFCNPFGVIKTDSIVTCASVKLKFLLCLEFQNLNRKESTGSESYKIGSFIKAGLTREDRLYFVSPTRCLRYRLSNKEVAVL